MTDLSWTVPAAAQAWENREQIVSLWEKTIAFLLGRKTRIAFTGVSGTGKTVLLDCLTGKAFRQDYTPPKHSSAEEEKGRLAAKGKRIALTVVPGQAASTTRFDVLEELFDPDDPVEGVVHVVANGFVEIRDATAREALAKEGKLDTLQKFRAHQMEEEVKHLADLCRDIRRCQSKSRRPRWVLVAVTKADLFLPEIEAARLHYSPAGDGQFVTALKALKLQIGEDNFTWTAVPVCGWPEDFHWPRLYVIYVAMIGYAIIGGYFGFRFFPGSTSSGSNSLNVLSAVLIPVFTVMAMLPIVLRFQRRRRSELRALDEVLELLREVESAIAKEERWSTLERAEFRIRLSRFYVRSRYR